MKRPNVLFILADQHNAKCLGHAGHPVVRTPHLDRLAAEGTRCTTAVCQNPICTPSRVCFLSGQYAHNHGYHGNEGPHPAGLPTVLGQFRAAGWRTGAIGKIHCPADWVEDDCDVFHETCDGCSVGGISRRRRDYLTRHQVREHDYGTISHDGAPELCPYRDSIEGWVASESIAFMEESRREGRPFFLHASFPKPHQPYTPAQEFWDLYPREAIALPPNFAYDTTGKAPHLIHELERTRRRTNWFSEPRTYQAAAWRKLQGYYGCITHMDHAVGELLAHLDAAGLAEDTIVVYSSDHGDYACEHGLMEKAPGICSDAVTRIPLLWRWPGRIRAGQTVDAIVESTDLAPTLCALAGLPAMPTADGADLSLLLAGDGGPGPHRIGVTEFPFSKSVRSGRHRLVWYPRWFFAETHPDGFGELYDLETDPWEMHNLWADPAHQGTVRRLTDELMDWLVSTTRPVTVLPNVLAQGPDWRTRFKNSVQADGKVDPARFRHVPMQDRLRL